MRPNDDSANFALDEDILEVTLCDLKGNSPSEFHTLDTLVVDIQFSLHPRPEQLEVVVQLLTPGDELSVSHFSETFSLADSFSSPPMAPKGHHHHQGDVVALQCIIPELLLRAGKYRYQ